MRPYTTFSSRCISNEAHPGYWPNPQGPRWDPDSKSPATALPRALTAGAGCRHPPSERAEEPLQVISNPGPIGGLGGLANNRGGLHWKCSVTRRWYMVALPLNKKGGKFFPPPVNV